MTSWEASARNSRIHPVKIESRPLFFCCCRRVWDSFDPPRHEPVMTSSWYSALINEHQKILNFVAQGIGKRSKAQTALFLIWCPCKVSRIAWCSVNIRSLEPALHKGEERMTWDLVKKTDHNDALSRLPVVLYIYPFHLGSHSFDFNPCKTHHLYVLPASRRRFLRWMISKITKKTVLKLTKTPSQGTGHTMLNRSENVSAQDWSWLLFVSGFYSKLWFFWCGTVIRSADINERLMNGRVVCQNLASQNQCNRIAMTLCKHAWDSGLFQGRKCGSVSHSLFMKFRQICRINKVGNIWAISCHSSTWLARITSSSQDLNFYYPCHPGPVQTCLSQERPQGFRLPHQCARRRGTGPSPLKAKSSIIQLLNIDGILLKGTQQKELESSIRAFVPKSWLSTILTSAITGPMLLPWQQMRSGTEQWKHLQLKCQNIRNV